MVRKLRVVTELQRIFKNNIYCIGKKIADGCFVAKV